MTKKEFQTEDYCCTVTVVYDSDDERHCASLHYHIPDLGELEINLKMSREPYDKQSAQRLFDGQTAETVQNIYEMEVLPGLLKSFHILGT